jgi:hypothetical protein
MNSSVGASYDQFFTEQENSLSKARETLKAHHAGYLQSYARLVSLNAWRKYLFPTLLGPAADGFFIEAQNDCLVSLILARHGMWRPSLQSMRSGIENALASLYFKDHAVEYRLWHHGKLRMTFTELKQYFETHPDLAQLAPKEITGLSMLDEQYGILSRAVHGSALRFRMTAGTEVPVAFTSDSVRLGQWITNQKRVLAGINLLLIALFREHLKGTAHTSLRSSLAMVVPKAMRARCKTQLGVTIPEAK